MLLYFVGHFTYLQEWELLLFGGREMMPTGEVADKFALQKISYILYIYYGTMGNRVNQIEHCADI